MVSQGFTAIVMAAGKGTRMCSSLPKVLHTMLGRSMLFHVLRALRDAGAERAIVVVGYGRDLVEKEVQHLATELKLRLETVEQKQQLGTGHAVQSAWPLLQDLAPKENVIIVNGDALLLQSSGVADFLANHRARKAELSLGCMDLENPTGYGRVIERAGLLKAVVEEKDASPKERKISLVNGGLYCVQAGLLGKLLPKLKPSPVTKEFYLTEVIALAAAAKKRAVALHLPTWVMQGANDLQELSEAEQIALQRLLQKWMRQGVKILDPRRVWIDESVELAMGVCLEPGVMLLGKTKLGPNVVVEAGARLEHVTVAAGARIKAYSYLSQSEVGESAQVGPFTHLRPGSVLGKNVKIGNFVEIKKSHVGADSKLSHLSYLGDAEVGSNVNIGCGFITCNYDGFQKHKTTIDDNAFIGSDVQVIAPLQVGEGAYVASGTTLTRDIPKGALAIARVKQDNKEGYAKRLKQRLQRAAKKE